MKRNRKTRPASPWAANLARRPSADAPTTNDLTGGTSDHDKVVQQAAEALVKAAEIYKNKDAEARLKGEYYDDFVQVEVPGGGHWLPIDQLGDACSIAKRTVGKLKVVAFVETGKVFVRQVASCYMLGEAVGEVVGEIGNALLPFQSRPQRFVLAGTGGLYGSDMITAPDVTVRSRWRPDGQPTRDSELGPIFFAEIEHGNRSLPELIRYLGMLLVNFPNLNGVLGIKGEEDRKGNKVNVLILIEWRENMAGVRRPHVTQLVDFGPHPYSDAKKGNANDALKLPLPYPVGTVAQGGVHGAGAADPLPEWTRFASGMNGDNLAIIHISPTLLLSGAHSTYEGLTINIPANALPANINLASLVDIFEG
jgi:hypothetical protein